MRTHRFTVMVLALLFSSVSLAGKADAKDDKLTDLEKKFGIKAVSLHISGAGRFLDFRYKVIDAEKAKPLFNTTIKPYIFDPSIRMAVAMPEDTKLGALRASVKNPPVSGKQYYVLFENPLGAIKTGKRVTVAIGDFKINNFRVD